jgi:hypothetical protein
MEGYNLRFWADYYEVQILSLATGLSRPGNLRRIHFYQKGYDGNPFEIHREEDFVLTAESVVTFEMVVDEQLFGPIAGRKAKIQLVVSDTFGTQDLYSNSDRDFLITIDESSNDGVTYEKNLFTGWVSALDVKEPYGEPPYVVEISASCGIASLKNIPYSTFPSKAIRRGIGDTNEALLHCLAHVGYDLPVYTSLPIAEQLNQLPTPGITPPAPFSPLVYARHDEQLFRGKSCYEVLTAILETLGARICQQEGAVRIIRWGQYRTPITSEPIGYNPETAQWRNNGSVQRGTPPVGTWLIEERIDRQVHHTGEGEPIDSELFYEPIYHQAEVAVSYGDYRNELENGDFAEVTGLLPTGYQGSNFVQARRIGTGTVDQPYALQIDGFSDTYENRPDGYFVMFPLVSIPSRNGTNLEEDIWKLNLTYINRNTRGVKIMVLVKAGNDSFYLQPDSTWKEGSSNGKNFSFYYTHDNFLPDGSDKQIAKPTKGVDVEIEMPSIPTTKAYTIQIIAYRGRRLDGQTNSPPPQIDIQNVRLSRKDSSKLELKGERYVATVQTEDPIREVEETTLILGDQLDAKREYLTIVAYPPPPVITRHTYFKPRMGALRRVDDATTEGWQTRPNTFDQNKPLGMILAYERLALMAAIRRGFDGELFCVEPIRPLDVLIFPELLDASNQPIRMLIISHSVGDQTQIARVRAVAIPATIVGQITVKGNWETPDGVLIPMDESEIGASNTGPAQSKYSGVLQSMMNKVIAQKLPGIDQLNIDIKAVGSDGQGHTVLPPSAMEQIILKVRDKGIVKYVQPPTKLLNLNGLIVR